MKNLILGDSEIGQINLENYFNATRGGEDYDCIESKVQYLSKYKRSKFDTIILGISPRLLTNSSKINYQTHAENIRKMSLIKLVLFGKFNLVALHSLIFNSEMSLGDGNGASNSETLIFENKLGLQNCHFTDSTKVEIDTISMNKLLNSLITKCKTLIFLSTPVSDFHNKTTPHIASSIYSKTIESLSLKYRVLNFRNEEWDNRYFKDQNHLNFNGTLKFKNEFYSKLYNLDCKFN